MASQMRGLEIGRATELTCPDCGRTIKGYGPYTLHKPQGQPCKATASACNARFWKHVQKTHRCWLWTSQVGNPDGYGRFSVCNRPVLAHRFAYETLVGPIPAGKEIDHLCRVRRCVKPSHLQVVSTFENQRRGIGVRGFRLTERQVRFIRQHVGRFGIAKLAKHFGCSITSVSLLVRRETWKDV